MELLVLAGGRVWPRGRLSCCEGAEMGTGLLRSTRLFSPSETVDQAVETYGLQKITLLREISLKTGIQVGMGQCPFISQLPQGPQGWGGGGVRLPLHTWGCIGRCWPWSLGLRLPVGMWVLVMSPRSC